MKPVDTLRFALSDRIRGAEIGPKNVPLALLGEFHKDVTEFLRGSGKDVDVTQATVAIEEGSFALAVSGLAAMVSLWADIQQLQSPDTLGQIDPKRAAVVERWQTAALSNPLRAYRMTDTDNQVSVTVNANTHFRNLQEAVWVSVEKYLHGNIVDWGGKTKPNIHLELEDGGKPLIVSATVKLLADETENRLYRPALLHVTAEENLKTGELRNLSLLSFETHKPVWDEAAFEALVNKGTRAWADVPNASAWLEELRGGGR